MKTYHCLHAVILSVREDIRCRRTISLFTVVTAARSKTEQGEMDMRHRRLKQLVTYKYGKGKEAKDKYDEKRVKALHFSTLNGHSVSAIATGKQVFIKKGVLDPTFMWHRDFEGFINDNIVEFGGDEYSYGTHFKANTKCW